MDKVGIYKGRVKQRAEGAWAQYGEKEKDGNTTLELLLDMEIQFPKEDGGPQIRTLPLYCTPAAWPFTLERLRACGWKGNDVADLTGVGDNEVDVQVIANVYDGKENRKYEIMSGGGRFTVQKPIDPKMFQAKLAAMTGGAPPPGAPKPPF